MTLSDDQEPHQPYLRDTNPKMILGAAALVAVLLGGWAYYLTSTERSDMAILLPGMTDPDVPLPRPKPQTTTTGTQKVADKPAATTTGSGSLVANAPPQRLPAREN